MSEMDLGNAGIHSHPFQEHDHQDIRAEIIAVQAQIEAAQAMAEAQQASTEATVAAEVAIGEAYDAKAEIAALNARIDELIAAQSQEPEAVIVEAPAPAFEEEPVEAPPEHDRKPPSQKKSSGLSWF